MRSPSPGVITYAQLQGSLHALFANNTAMAKSIKKAMSLRASGNFDAAREVEEDIVSHIAKDKQLMAKVRKALQAHYTALRPILLPAAARAAKRGAPQEPEGRDPFMALAEITLAAVRARQRRRPVSSTTSDSGNLPD